MIDRFDDVRIDTVQVLLPVPLPGTELTARLKGQNRIYSTDLVGWEYYDGNFPLFQPDSSITPEEMHAAGHKVMGRFYRFKYMFAIGMHVLFFPFLLFHLHDLRVGWAKWYRRWRNSLIRFGGWITIKKWTRDFQRGNFSEKLDEAKRALTAPKAG